MRRIITLTATIGFLLTSSAFASGNEGNSTSLALLLAKRVAAMEKSRELPSRAVWLSNRVISNARSLAYVRAKTGSKDSKKRPETIKN